MFVGVGRVAGFFAARTFRAAGVPPGKREGPKTASSVLLPRFAGKNG
jgi:hypothetical protein